MVKRCVYIDEAGNSGPNYLDANEKFFVLAGWLDVDNKFENLKNGISELLGSEEGKNYKLGKSVEGKNRMAAVLNYMLDNNCKPFVAIAEKKYCIAARIVEVLLDPFYNDRMPKNFDDSKNFKVKKTYADILYYNLDDDILADFSNAYRGKDIALDIKIGKMEKIIGRIVECLQKRNQIKLANCIKGAEKNISSNLCDEIPSNGDMVTVMSRQAPNYWIFNNMLNLLECNSIKYGYQIDVIHDIQLKYEKNIVEVFELNKKMWQCFGEIRFEDSKSNEMIQAADILAGAVNMILKRKNKAWRKDESFVAILKIMKPILRDFKDGENGNLHRTYFMQPEKEWNELMKFYEMESTN